MRCAVGARCNTLVGSGRLGSALLCSALLCFQGPDMSMIGNSGSPFFHACGSPGDYILTLLDAGEDGLCCANGEGFFLLMVGGQTVAFGSDFGSLINIVFSVDADVMLVSESVTITPAMGGKRRMLMMQQPQPQPQPPQKRPSQSQRPEVMIHSATWGGCHGETLSKPLLLLLFFLFPLFSAGLCKLAAQRPCVLGLFQRRPLARPEGDGDAPVQRERAVHTVDRRGAG